MKFSEDDQALRKIEMGIEVAQEKQKQLVKRLNEAVRSGVKPAKTPDRPVKFSGGATVARITPPSK